jgi:hypothetical protein
VILAFLLALLLSACGGVASAEELFADTSASWPPAPPPYCPQAEGTCGGSEPGPIQTGPAPLSHPPPDILHSAPLPDLDADGGALP